MPQVMKLNDSPGGIPQIAVRAAVAAAASLLPELPLIAGGFGGRMTSQAQAKAPLRGLAHGAGAGMNHPFLVAVAAGLARRGLRQPEKPRVNLTWIKCVDLQTCYSVKLGEALPWCCVPRSAARDERLEELRSNGRRLNKVAAPSPGRAQEVWAFAHPSDQTRWDYASQLSRECTYSFAMLQSSS
jgi:hypothetical protein